MENQNAAAMRRSRRVPRWFRGILHEIMYSDIVQAYSMLCAMDRLSSGSEEERTIVLLCATGLSQSEIAERLGISRFAVRRRIEVLRRRWNFDFAAAMKSVEPMSGLLVRFAERRGQENCDIAFALRSLAGFSLKELGVLFAIAKEQPQGEALRELSISRGHYSRIRDRLVGMFGLAWHKAKIRRAGRNYSFRDWDGFHAEGGGLERESKTCAIMGDMKSQGSATQPNAAMNGAMACADTAQNAAVRTSCIPPPLLSAKPRNAA